VVSASKCASCAKCVPTHSPQPCTPDTESYPQIIELPLLNPELFQRVGIKPPKGVLLYGPPGTGKTLLARAVAATLETNFLKVVSSAIVDKYIGESARVVREMFGYARDHEPCVIFMDEIDAIGGRRFSEGTSADREIQRTLMEVRPSNPISKGDLRVKATD
jgi:26S proteasome regulatory subunit T4